MSETILNVRDLVTEFKTESGVVRAVNSVSLEVGRGEIVGLVGESGSGKSVTGYSIMRLIEHPGRIVSGAVELSGRNLLSLTDAEMRQVRGAEIATVFQDPMTSLNPVLRVGTQMIEAIEVHRPTTTREQARTACVRGLEAVGIASAAERINSYPHQFSGGMRQRIGIATALLNNPQLIIADEPTTALDVTVQSQIIHEVQELCRKSGTAVLWITHDLSVVAALAQRIYVMYAGRIVESGSVDEVLENPQHPYTQGLLNSIPSRNPPGQPLPQIRGSMPSLAKLPAGCAFEPRCAHATPQCKGQPPEIDLHNGQMVRRWLRQASA